MRKVKCAGRGNHNVQLSIIHYPFYLLFALFVPLAVSAQKTTTVSGKYVYTVSDNDNITLKDAKRKCIELAKAQAIKNAFGEMITSDVIDSNAETNGEASSSYYWENTVAMARGEWLADIKPPVLNVDYVDGKLVFIAEVVGKAREIIQAKADLKWSVLKDDSGEKIVTSSFISGERVYLKFRAPADGYLAVYLIVGDDETSCLLPYPKDAFGRFAVRGGRDYVLFDKERDPTAPFYKLNTTRPQEDNQLVVIWSPNPFTKCNDITGDARHPNSLSTHDFQKWLLKCQRQDHDMVVDKKWIKIHKPAVNKH